jgi:hypothetical protein
LREQEIRAHVKIDEVVGIALEALLVVLVLATGELDHPLAELPALQLPVIAVPRRAVPLRRTDADGVVGREA